ncbi:MAG: Asp-tRNA(Asn)/Glu-tRNA(Gln) amidotransferase subunit GatC [Patescibacteria group bacterium]
MSDLDQQSIKKVASLSRINDSPDVSFLEKYQRQLTSVLEYVKQLEEVDVSNVDPFSGSRTIQIDQLREDTPPLDVQQYAKTKAEIIDNFPEKNGNLLVVAGIFG